MTQSNTYSSDDINLPLRSEAAQTFMRLVAKELKGEGVSSIVQGMMEEADKACAKYDAAGQKQAGGTVRKSYIKFMNLLATEALRQGLIVSEAMARRVVASDDPARQDPPAPPLPEDEFEAALVKEIGARAPSPSPRGEVSFEPAELDEIERQLQIEMEVKRSREAYAQFAETAARFMLERLKEVTKPGDYFRQLPQVFKQPDPPNCASGHFADNAFVLLPSVTFQYQGKTITRNCAVNNRTVKVGHPLAFKLPDGSHLIRSFKPEQGKEERWVKAIRYTEGAIIRYFTHIEDQDTSTMRWYGVIRRGEIKEVSEAEYRGLEAALKD